MHAFSSTSVEQTQDIGRALAGLVKPDDVIVLDGDLGAGKTQFSKGLAKGLGVTDEVTSPTFNILLEYEGDELALFHFDLYRLDTQEELDDIDFYGVLESDGVSLVEWGGKFAEALPEERLDVFIRMEEDGDRSIQVEGIGARGRELEDGLARALSAL
ncbi:MAG: tRNA (adenosine(37)-N6)-threonylcarbamoyltransferase complex ATPase subunit type 1 TsaE [Coriobacteriales bacterium]|jgi:tRNA threonylcarbamoyladenosine biosynthesis protein TsaE